MKLYEILIPQNDDPKKYEVITKKIVDLTGGFTSIFPQNEDRASGIWRNAEGEDVIEKLHIIRVAVASRGKLLQVLKVIQQVFEQESVMAYEVSNDVIFYPEQ